MHPPFSVRASLTAITVAALAIAITTAPSLCAGKDLQLQIEAHQDHLDFRLDGASSETPWILQYSPNLESWEDLLFFDLVVIGGGKPRVSIPWRGLPDSNAATGYFRARQLREDDSFLRELLDARVRWRQSGSDHYQYVLERPNQFYWRGRIIVADDEVANFRTIELHPPFAEVPAVPTIDDLFERISTAVANGAASIEVTWDPVRGYPTRCFIDPVALIADDEERWIIESFIPLR